MTGSKKMSKLSYKDNNFFIEKLFEISKRNNILDVGGGAGFSKEVGKYKDWFANTNYRSFDIPTSGANIEGDIHDMNLPNESEDAVICNAVLEHVVDPIRAVEEIQRILKTGGVVLIQVPSIYPYHRNKGAGGHDGYGDYWRFFDDTLRYMFRNFSHVEIVKQSGFFRTMIVFLPFDKKLFEKPAEFLDRLLKTEQKGNTTRGYCLYAIK